MTRVEGTRSAWTRDVHGTASLVVRAPGGSAVVSRRFALAIGVVAVVILVLAVIDLALGDIWIAPNDLPAVLFSDSFQRTIVVEWRMPRVTAAIAFGAALGLSGAILQSLTRNPLGSPDMVGLDSGAYTAVAVTMLVLGARDFTSVSIAAIVGAAIVSAAIYLLAWRRGIQGFRLIVVGIGVSAMLGAFNNYLITRANDLDAIAVGVWGAGSITTVTWGQVGPAVVVIVALFAIAAGSGHGSDSSNSVTTRPPPMAYGSAQPGSSSSPCASSRSRR